MPRRVAMAVVVAVLVAGGGVGWFLLPREPPLPRREVAAYLEAWERFDVGAMRALTVTPPPEMDGAVAGM